ncbi:uncharacterized protein LOC122837173 [Gambusia affinis]|uniref:uncharacterized protein LOC122837173 n=1 Tax=Gambusia affinis TaxID=33528 RepID=UPI001CDB79CC|nr:uncharacterized protein LOC122837173 [Gambusia affinis]XP_043983276.1 uncharacterized protein LOC122837173 [Gambusia affinis]XP_043983277.1 uncharacterized protein LOC122837173 [Gambusia affinis]XP_043983278.1 uncharacterized protein LOC122837173 [Gambusia affinis]
MGFSIVLRNALQVIVDDSVIPAIDEFFHYIPEGKWEDLASGCPDQSIRKRIADLLYYITQVCSDVVLDIIKNCQYHYKDLKAIMGNIISQAFARAMDMEEPFQTESTDMFNMVFLKHVISAATCPLDKEDPTQWLQVGVRFNILIQHVTIMIRELLAMRRKIEKLRKSNLSSDKFSDIPEDGVSEKDRKDTVRLFVNLLLSRSIKKAKTCCFPDHLKITEERVVEKIWARVERQKFQIKEKCIPHLCQKVFKNITETLGCSSGRTLALIEHNLVDNVVVSCFENELKKHQKKKNNSFRRFFSRAIKTLTHTFH